MVSNRLAFGALALACVVAAGAGGYFARRQSSAPSTTVETPVAAVAPTTGSSTLELAGRPVEETEAILPPASEKTTAENRPTTTKRANVPPPVARPAPRQPPIPATPRSSPPIASTRTPSSDADAPEVERIATGTANGSVALPAGVAPPPGEAPVPVFAQEERSAPPEPARVPEPPAKSFEELIVSADSVVGLQTETTISSERARVEDKVDARVTRDVRVGTRVAIPSGSRVLGSVTLVERGGKFKERARLGIRFHTVVLADGSRIPMTTDTFYREGEAPASASKIGGGAIGGAIIGAILGGAKGAAIGAGAGAAGGTAMAAAGDRSAVTLPAGTTLTVRLLSSVTVTVEK